LPLGTPPHPQETASEGDWAPFDNEIQFHLADLVYHRAELLALNVNLLLQLWAQSTSQFGTPAPFKNRDDMHVFIDSLVLGDVPWQCLVTTVPEGIGEDALSWMHMPHEIWYCNPETVVSAMLSNPDFQGQFDLRLYVDINVNSTRQWSNVMSGNIAWRHSISRFLVSSK
jgi:hypothetical protein